MSTRLPSLNGLRVFESAARHLSFTKAAAELHVTQTAVSHQIKRLEEHFGKPLFVRRNRNLSLTPDAQEYLIAVRAAFDGLRAGTEAFMRDEDNGILTVTTVTSFAVKWLIPKLGAFQARHPDIDVRISTSLNLTDLRGEDVDVAIRFGQGNWPGLRADHLMQEDAFPVCSPDLLRGPHPLNSPADLAHHTLLHTSPWPDAWRLWLTAADALDGINPTAGPSFDLALLSIQAAIDGLGVAMTSGEYVERDLAEGRLVRPFNISLPPQAAYYLVAPAERADTPKVAAFREWLLEITG